MTAAQPEIPVLASIAEIGASYKVWLVDIWGVMHDGLRAHRSAVEATKAFRERGGIVVLLSNSPRPSPDVKAQLLSLGVPADAYDATVTSGDLTRYELEKRMGARVFHLGPERDRPIFAGLKLSLTEPDQAQIIVCTGLFDDESETPEDYDRLLKDLAERGLPMICANPDRMVERGKQLIYCAGALAERYAADGGSVIYAGKPYAPIYALAFEAANRLAGREIAPDEVLAIGDGIMTDMEGATGVGLDAVFIASGLHLDKSREDGLDRSAVASLFAGRKPPLAALDRLVW
ncbi:MAG TPA: TIGR01459 family HAD-type hydrolase [Methyloceanibacter sp.]|nr:TIGR01459 family HAD-type hydrolase [Methyloceanibacter sp.]